MAKTEQLARALLRHYLPRERFLYNLRPDWLRYPPIGRNLELDIFLPGRIIAIEVQGVQHGRHIAGLQPTFTDFLVQQRRDAYKREAYQLQGVALYTLTSFHLLQRNLEPFIRQFMTESEWRNTTPPLNLYRQAEQLIRMKVVRPRRRSAWHRLLRLVGFG